MSKLFTVERHQVECKSYSALIIDPAMQSIEIGHAIQSEPHNLGIKNCTNVDPGRSLDNARIAFRPIGSSNSVEPHPTIANMDL
jgi:hypothetical protein